MPARSAPSAPADDDLPLEQLLTAPHAIGLAALDRRLETQLANRAPHADRLRPQDVDGVLGEEQSRERAAGIVAAGVTRDGQGGKRFHAATMREADCNLAARRQLDPARHAQLSSDPSSTSVRR